MKGQSAIEYLMTYGWMLIAVSIVGGATYSVIGQQSCLQSSTSFTGSSVAVGNFGLQAESNNLAYIIENRESNSVDINSIIFERGENTVINSSGAQIDIQSEETFVTEGFSSSSACNTFDVVIDYDLNSGSASLQNLQSSGQITGNIQIGNETEQTQTEAPPAPENVSISYTG